MFLSVHDRRSMILSMPRSYRLSPLPISGFSSRG